MSSQRWLERVMAGEPFEMPDWEFIGAVQACAAKVVRFNAEADFFRRREMLREIFGSVGENVVVLAGLSLDVGFNIAIGDDSFINVNVTLLDTYPIRIGARVQIGPNCGFYPVGHPVEAKNRSYRDPATAELRGLTTGAPIVIEDETWLGGHVVVLPGVTIGTRSVIGAGSVVTKSIPPDVFAAGNPCRVIRPIDNSEFEPIS
jgi:acetyltransferase-like isoleucine patch superfamily enzyme